MFSTPSRAPQLSSSYILEGQCHSKQDKHHWPQAVKPTAQPLWQSVASQTGRTHYSSSGEQEHTVMPLGYLGPAVPFEALEPEDRHAWFGQLRVIPWILAAVALGLSVESIALIILAKQQCLGASYPVSR